MSKIAEDIRAYIAEQYRTTRRREWACPNMRKHIDGKAFRKRFTRLSKTSWL